MQPISHSNKFLLYIYIMITVTLENLDEYNVYYIFLEYYVWVSLERNDLLNAHMRLLFSSV